MAATTEGQERRINIFRIYVTLTLSPTLKRKGFRIFLLLLSVETYCSVVRGYNFILVAIDIFSKYVWLRPLKDKRGESVMKALKNIFAEGRSPRRIYIIYLGRQNLLDLTNRNIFSLNIVPKRPSELCGYFK
jgi:hypothetical protein